jgi:hypothetical protein
MPMSGTLGWALPTIHHWITDIFFNLELDSRDLLCYSRCMNETQLIQGRLISPEDIEQIRALMIENPKWHRTRLSIPAGIKTWPAALYCLSWIGGA